MKKLAIFAALALATPVFACPNMDHDNNDQRTAENQKKDAPKADKAKEAPKAEPKKDEAKPAETAKAKDTAAPKKTDDKSAKKPEKVSSK